MSKMKKIGSLAMVGAILGQGAIPVVVHATEDKKTSTKDTTADKNEKENLQEVSDILEDTNYEVNKDGVVETKKGDGSVELNDANKGGITAKESDGWLIIGNEDAVESVDAQSLGLTSDAKQVPVPRASGSGNYITWKWVDSVSNMSRQWLDANGNVKLNEVGIAPKQVSNTSSAPKIEDSWNGKISPTAGGEIVFCIEVGVKLNENQGEISPDGKQGTGGGFKEEQLSGDEKDMLELIAYYGWESRDKTVKNYMFTQNMLWEYLVAHGHKGIGVSKPGKTSGPNWGDYDGFKSSVNSKIDSAKKGVKWDKGADKSNPIKLKKGEQVVVTDTSGLLKNEGITNVNTTIVNDAKGNVDVVSLKDGKLTLKASDKPSSNSMGALAIPSFRDVSTGTTFVYKKANQQATSNFKIHDPLRTRVFVQVEDEPKPEEPTPEPTKGGLELTKTGDVPTKVVTERDSKTGKDVTKVAYEKKGLAGVEYTVTGNGETFKLTTDSNGKASKSDLKEGTYKIKETKAPDGYILDSKEYTVEVKDSTTSSVTTKQAFHNDLRPIDLNVVKEGEVEGNKTKKLSGALFGIYSSSDIKVGNDTIKAGSLMGVSETGSDGIAKFKEKYPEGKFYLEELKAPDGYVAKTGKLAEFDLDRKTSDATATSKILYLYSDGLVNDKEDSSKKPFFNELGKVPVEKKGGLQIIKKGEVPNKLVTEKNEEIGKDVTKVTYTEKGLAGVKYKVTDSNGKEILDNGKPIVTKEDGKVKLEGLDEGKYTIKEIEAPKGYIVDDKEYVVDVKSVKGESKPGQDAGLTSVVTDKSFQNKLRPIQLNVVKEGEKVTSWGTEGAKTQNVPLENIVFGIYNKNDITVGDETIKADTLMGVGKTDEKGLAKMEEKYPNGDYVLRELKTNDTHELLKGNLSEFTLNNDSENNTSSIKELYLYSNGLSEGKADETKTPFLNKLKLGKFRLVKEVEVRDSQDAKEFKSHYETGKLAKGTEFELTLDKAKDGVMLDENIKGGGDTTVKPTEDSKEKDKESENTKPSEDGKTESSASGEKEKTDLDNGIDALGENANNSNKNKATLVVGESGDVVVRGLPEGEYSLVETKAPSEKHKFKNDVYKLNVTAEKTVITLDGKEVGVQEEVKTTAKTLDDFIKEETANMLSSIKDNNKKATPESSKEEGKGDSKKETEEVKLTDEQESQVKDIAQQKYDKYVEENKDNKGTEKIDTVKIKNDLKKGKVDFSKVDITGEKELEGAEIRIKGKDTDFSFTSGKKPTRFTLEDGTYTFSETTAPAGYIRTTETGTFTVKDGEITKCILRNRPKKLPTTGNDLGKSSLIITALTGLVAGMSLYGTQLLKRKNSK